MTTCNLDVQTSSLNTPEDNKNTRSIFDDDDILDQYIDDEINEMKERYAPSSWYNNVIDFWHQYNILSDKHRDLHEEILNTIIYVENLKVPFCYECSRLAFGKAVSEMLQECDDIGFMMSSYPNEIRYHQDMVIEHGSEELSASSVAMLQSILEFHAHRIDTLKEDFEGCMKEGENVLNDSKLIERPCGF